MTISWYVAEFASGVQGPPRFLEHDRCLTSERPPGERRYRPAACLIVTYRAEGDIINENDLMRATITSATNLQLSFNPANQTTTQVVEWQVVEYTDAAVQSGEVSFAATDTTVTTDIPLVDPAKTWLLFSYECGGSGCPDAANIGARLVRGALETLSGPPAVTRLTFTRGSPTVSDTLTLAWYVVTFTDATTVQRDTAVLGAAELTSDVTLAPTFPGLTIAAAAGLYMRGGGDIVRE